METIKKPIVTSMEFLYFIPNHRGGAADSLPQEIHDVWGRNDKGDKYSGASAWTAKGPGGLEGSIIMRGSPAAHVGFEPNRQTWKKFGSLWIGLWSDYRPTPDDLKRCGEQTTGLGYYRLSDGNSWLLPTVSALPSYLGYDDDGQPSGEIVTRQYRHLQELGAQWFDKFVAAVDKSDAKTATDDSENPKEETPEENRSTTLRCETSDFVACLAINYRVGPHEVSLLEMPLPFDIQVATLVLSDFVLDRDVAKKKSD